MTAAYINNLQLDERMNPIFLDTETLGLHGPIVLYQYAVGDGPINLWSVWREPIDATLGLIEAHTNHEGGIVGFNLSYDWFHICQLYTTLLLLKERVGGNEFPIDFVEDYVACEPEARLGPCLKPTHCLDLMLHARKGPYQNTMNRKDIRIKRVPTQLAWELADELDRRIQLKDVYFARHADPTKRWSVRDVFDDFGILIPHLKDVVLSFAPSSALKALAHDALGIKKIDILQFKDVDPPSYRRVVEYGYAPFAKGVPERNAEGKLNRTWPIWLDGDVSHWSFNSLARKYAEDDVVYTRGLYEHFDAPGMDDIDSILACMVGAVRWRGFAIDVPGLAALRDDAIKRLQQVKFNYNSGEVCRRYLCQVMTADEQLVLRHKDKITTKAPILEEVARWTKSDVCEGCLGMGCDTCGNSGLIESNEPHEAAGRAQEILDARHAKKEVELYDKLIAAGRFHASFDVIGARSSRMSGSGGDLNPQGIKHSGEVRACFPLADRGLSLCGGDLSGSQIAIADAVFQDPDLHAQLMTGKKLYGIFGEFLFPGESYDDILATKGLPNEQDHYDRSKKGVLAMLFGGEEYTLQTRVGISEAGAADAWHNWCNRYKEWARKRQEYVDMFCSMRQPGGIGTKVEWNEPADFIEALFGFRRYFTLENEICRSLFNLAEKPPSTWTKLKVKVTRRDREQTVTGAVRSALFAAAFALQAQNMRAAANHVIQSPEAIIVKTLQTRIWDLQPVGIGSWQVQPMNIHDELQVPAIPELKSRIHEIVDEYIAEVTEDIPLMAIEWKDNTESWADK
jgi:hypothetical protein